MIPVTPLNWRLGNKNGLLVQASSKFRRSKGRANEATWAVCIRSVTVPTSISLDPITLKHHGTVPIVQASLSHPQICLEAFITEPGLIWALILVIVDQNPRDESDIADGPFKLTDESIDRVVSANVAYANRSKWRIVLIKTQAALEVRWEVETRDVTSQALCQHVCIEGLLASELPARLYIRQSKPTCL